MVYVGENFGCSRLEWFAKPVVSVDDANPTNDPNVITFDLGFVPNIAPQSYDTVDDANKVVNIILLL